jgi:hypothetical protein
MVDGSTCFSQREHPLGLPTIPHILIALNSNILPVLAKKQKSLGELNFTIPANTVSI